MHAPLFYVMLRFHSKRFFKSVQKLKEKHFKENEVIYVWHIVASVAQSEIL